MSSSDADEARESVRSARLAAARLGMPITGSPVRRSAVGAPRRPDAPPRGAAAGRPTAFRYHPSRCSNGPRCPPGRASSAPGFPASRSVSIAAYVLAGSRLETAGEVGVAHFMEHLTFKGTAAYPSTRAISEAIEGVGGSFNAATDRESTVYWVRVPRREAARAMDVLGELIVRPDARPTPTSRASGRSSSRRSAPTSTTRPSTARSCSRPRCSATGRSVARSAATRRASGPCRRPRSATSGGPPTGRPTRSSRSPATSSHDEARRPRRDGVRDRATASVPGFAPAPTLPAGPRVHGSASAPRRQAQLCVGVPALRRDHPDSWTLAVLNAVLGDGMSSRLFLSVREERGLAYDVSSGLVDYADAGALEISAGVDPGRAAGRPSRRSWSSSPGCATSPSRPTSSTKAKRYLAGRPRAADGRHAPRRVVDRRPGGAPRPRPDARRGARGRRGRRRRRRSSALAGALFRDDGLRLAAVAPGALPARPRAPACGCRR